MRKIIHHVRKQPEEVRRHILHATTVVCAVILFFLWVWSLGRNFSREETRAEVSNDLQPLSVLKANIIGGYQSITE